MSQEKNSKGWILTTVAIILLLSGFFIWRKSWKISHENNYYAYYSDVKGLQASSHVHLKGVSIGKISDIDLNIHGKVKVTITLKKETQLPEGTVALLASDGLLGNKSIRLVEGTGPGIIENGRTIPTAFDTSVMATSIQITPYIETLTAMLGYADSGLHIINNFIRTGGLMTSFTNTVITIDEKSKKYSSIVKNINEESIELANSINSIHTSVNKVAANNKNIKNTINNTETKTTEVANASIKKNIHEIQLSINELSKTFRKINSQDSGIGKLVNNDTTYRNTVTGLENMNKNMQELKANPPGFSIIGGKKKKK